MGRMEQLERLHAADPGDADVMYMLALECVKAGHGGEALAWFDRCLAADAAYHYAYFHKARAQQSMGDEAGALETSRAGVALASAAGCAKAAGELAALIEELEG